MKLLHVADLHIGKRVNECNLLEDQNEILNQIVAMVQDHQVDALLIAGDVYDKSMPSAEAVALLDSFLTRLLSKTKVFLISGNHDSPERLSFGSSIFKENGVYIAGVYEKEITCITLEDEFGPLHIHLLPYVKPSMVQPFVQKRIESHHDAVGVALESHTVNTSHRNVLVAHQFVTAGMELPLSSDSETISIGGLDYVDAGLFAVFDYVALGHLHGPQKIGRSTVRYAGSPLKYSFSEANHHKSAVLLTWKEKSDLEVTLLPFHPLKDMRKIKGPLQELINSGLQDDSRNDFIHATVTDDEELYDAIGQLRQVYPNIMALELQQLSAKEEIETEESLTMEDNPLELFEAFYAAQQGTAMTETQKNVVFQLMKGEQIA